MPYVTPDARNRLDLGGYPETVGELNYVITRVVTRFLSRGPVGYTALNAVMGVLESAKLELYRRAVAPYEDRKCQENGDVYCG